MCVLSFPSASFFSSPLYYMDKLFSSGSKQQKVLALVASAQASGENPLEAVDDYLWEQLVPTVPPSLPYQLYAISGILGLCV